MNSGWWWLVTNWRACFKFQCPFPGWTPAGNHHYFLLLHIVTSMWEPSLRNMLFWSKWGSYVLIIQQVHQLRWTHHPMWDIDNGGCSARVGIYRKSLQLPLNFSETKTVLKIVLIKTCKATTTVGSKTCHSKMFLFGMRIDLGWFILRKRRLRKFFYVLLP